MSVGGVKTDGDKPCTTSFKISLSGTRDLCIASLHMSTKKRRPGDADSLALVPAKRAKFENESQSGELITTTKVRPIVPSSDISMLFSMSDTLAFSWTKAKDANRLSDLQAPTLELTGHAVRNFGLFLL